MSSQISTHDCFFYQSGVIPYKVSDGKLKVLLITSRRKQKWILPKGFIEPDMTPQESAAIEAYEEAGVEGEVSSELIGTYNVNKWEGTCNIKVYPMLVKKIHDKWPESYFRKREWMDIEEALEETSKDSIKQLLVNFKDSFHF